MGHVARRGFWDAAGCFAWGDALVSRGVFGEDARAGGRGSHEGGVVIVAVVMAEAIWIVGPVEL